MDIFTHVLNQLFYLQRSCVILILLLGVVVNGDEELLEGSFRYIFIPRQLRVPAVHQLMELLLHLVIVLQLLGRLQGEILRFTPDEPLAFT
ncbi:hypothetical protein D3C73_1427040 [compost metagenome]